MLKNNFEHLKMRECCNVVEDKTTSLETGPDQAEPLGNYSRRRSKIPDYFPQPQQLIPVGLD